MAELAWQLSRYLWRGSVNFNINSRPLSTIICLLKYDNFRTRDFSPLIEGVLAGVYLLCTGILYKLLCVVLQGSGWCQKAKLSEIMYIMTHCSVGILCMCFDFYFYGFSKLIGIFMHSCFKNRTFIFLWLINFMFDETGNSFVLESQQNKSFKMWLQLIY